MSIKYNTIITAIITAIISTSGAAEKEKRKECITITVYSYIENKQV